VTADATTDGVAERILVRYAPVTDRITAELETPRYAAYLRRAESGPVAVDDEWSHFVSRGCGATADVALTVERVEGGDRVGAGTEFGFVPATAGEDGGEPAETESVETESATGDGD